jgi:hypothetical protein
LDGPGGAVSWAADIASVASLAVSGYVAWQVRGIKARLVRRFVVTTFIEQLKVHSKVLRQSVRTSGIDNLLIDAELARCEANFAYAIPRLDSSLRPNAQQILDQLTARPSDIRSLYIAMVRLLQSLENAAAEQEVRAHVE